MKTNILPYQKGTSNSTFNFQEEHKIRGTLTTLISVIALLFFTTAPLWATDHSGTITTDTTWYAADNPHVIVGHVTVTNGVTLTLEDGVNVQFNDNLWLYIHGTLMAAGSAGTGILFTRSGDINGNGLYFFTDGTGTFDYCTIEYADYGIYTSSTDTISISNSIIQNNGDGVNATAGTVELANTTLRNNTSYGFYGYGVVPVLLDVNTIFENNATGIYLRSISGLDLSTAAVVRNNTSAGIYLYNCTGGVALDNLTLQGNGGTYGAIYMQSCGEFTIGGGNTIGGVGQENSWPVTIDLGSYPSAACSGNIPTSGNIHNGIQVYGGSSAQTGTWRRFAGLDYIVTNVVNILAGGVLNIGDSVTVRFDHGQYINVYGTLNAAGTGSILFTRYEPDDQWFGLLFYSGSGGTLQGCTIEQATYSTGYGIYAANATLTIDSCTVRESDYGIYADGIFPTIGGCTIRDNDYGIYVQNVASPALTVANVIKDNNVLGVHFYNCTSPSLSNQTISGHNGTYGAIFMDRTGEFTIGGGNIIGGVGQENSWPVTVNLGSYPSVDCAGNIPSTGNFNNGIQVYGGSSAQAITWHNFAGLDYIVTNMVTISAGGVLDIADSVTVRFDQGQYLNVYGTLNAMGTESILFSRYESGDQWYGLFFNSSSGGTLQGCTIEHATYSNGYGIYANGAFPAIENCTIRDNDYGIYAQNVVSPALSGVNVIQDNTITGVYFYNCTDPSVSNQTISGHNTTYGAMFMNNTGEFTIGGGNLISGNSWPVTMNIGSYPSLASAGNIPASGNTHNDIQVYGGSSADSVAWPDVAVDYVVTSTPAISAGGVLDIADSVTVRFDQGQYLNVYGTLNAMGTESILFTRYEPDDQWYGLLFYSGSGGTLQGCTIEHATYSNGYGIYANGAFPAIENCTIRDNDYGIYTQNVAFPTLSGANVIQDNSVLGIHFYNCTDPSLSNQTISGHNSTYGAIFMDHTGEFTIGSGNTITGNSWPVTMNIGSYPSLVSAGNIPASGNTHNDIQVYGGSSADSVAWPDVAVDYVVTSTPAILAGGVLDIADSVTVRFDQGQYLNVYGTLNAMGTESILFSRYEPGDQWYGLFFNSGSGGTLQGCTIEHATYSNGYGIYANGAFPAIENCTIRDNDYGIYVQNVTSPTLSGANVIQDNTITGVHFYNCTDPSLSNQTISGHNTTYGAMFMNNTGEFTIGGGNLISGNSWPVTVNIGSYPSLASDGNIPASGNTHNDIQVYGGSSADSVVWPDVAVDYVVTSTPAISAGGVLDIADSVTVRFDQGQYLNVYGTLNAMGTESILFSRYESGDQWYGLWFYNGSGGTLQGCTIEYATYATGYGIHVQPGADTISFSNCTIQNNDYGVFAAGGILSFLNSAVIHNSEYGIHLSGAVPVSFGENLSEWNDIYGNGPGNAGRDLHNDTLDTYAPYVYWGTVKAPEIEARIWEKDDDPDLGAVCYAPWSNASHDGVTALWMNVDLEDGAKSSSGNMYLDWSEYCGQGGADHYVVYRSTTVGDRGDSLASTTDNWYLDVGTAGDVGTQYYYTVEVVDGVGGRYDSNQAGEYDIGMINGLKALTDGRREDAR